MNSSKSRNLAYAVRIGLGSSDVPWLNQLGTTVDFMAESNWDASEGYGYGQVGRHFIATLWHGDPLITSTEGLFGETERDVRQRLVLQLIDEYPSDVRDWREKEGLL